EPPVGLCVALLLGLSWAEEGLGCPQGCTCERWEVACTGGGLDRVPSAIPLTTKVLVLANNSLASLPTVRDLPNLRSLAVSGNPWFCNCSFMGLSSWVKERRPPWTAVPAPLRSCALAFAGATCLRGSCPCPWGRPRVPDARTGALALWATGSMRNAASSGLLLSPQARLSAG
uniref:LRRNT domain-containing protein n=1 Tax=Varanus komodoensis TaxID=61221 RepID=A0A8D2LD27_VARKO